MVMVLVPDRVLRSPGIATVIGLFAELPSDTNVGPPLASSSIMVVVTVLVTGSGTSGMGRFSTMSRPVLSTSSIDAPATDLPPGTAGIAPAPLFVTTRLQTLVSVQVISNTCFEMVSSIEYVPLCDVDRHN